MRKLTHEEFLEKLYEKNEYYRRGEFAVEGEYSTINVKIKVVDNDGMEYLIRPSNLLNNVRPSTRNVINKTDYTIKKFKLIHGDKYNYDKVVYTGCMDKVTITCDRHGDFNVLIDEHNSGTGCPKCGVESMVSKRAKTTEEFIAQANEKHNFKYTYENLVYVNDSTNVDINCKIHGVFSQKPNNHLNGKGCRKCQYDLVSKLTIERGSTASYSQWGKLGMKSDNFESFKVYIVVCDGHGESFVKVGKTYNTVDKRLRYIPYSFKIHNVITGEDPIEVCKIEHSIKMSLKDYRYKTTKSFGGQYECFNIEALHNGTVDKLIKELNVSG